MARLGTLDNIRVRFALHYAKKRRLARMIAQSNPQPVAQYTSADRYSFAATRFRFPIVHRSISGSNIYCISQFVFASPDYDVTDPRFFLPGFISPSGTAETATSNIITIEGLSLNIGGTWHTVPSTNLPAVINPASMPGVLLDAVNVTIPANTVVTGRLAYNVPLSGQLPTVIKNTSLTDKEASLGSTSSLSAKLTDGSSLGNINVHSDLYAPSFMVAKGGDGRPAMMVVGDSIGFGAIDESTQNLWSPRHCFGFIERGLDDNATSKRISYGVFSISGCRPFGSNGWNVRSNWSRKLDAVKQVYDIYGNWPFDFVISQHGTNSLPSGSSANFRSGMESYFSFLTSEWSKPIVQAELLPKPSSTDGFGTLANQSATSADLYPSGERWTFNADVGTDGISDPNSYFRANGFIEDSFAPWMKTSYDLDANRYKLAVRPFNTTIASSYTSGGTISLTDAPTPGEILIFVQGGVVKFDCVVRTVTGSGPYSVNFIQLSSTTALNAGDIAQAAIHGKDGLHPGTLGHILYAQSVVDWKVSRGWT